MNNQEKFYSQSYSDALNDYVFSCKSTQAPHWNWIIITAANKMQAETYQLQIDERKKNNSLPLNTNFAVIPDLDDQRIGSGGATLNVIAFVADKVGYDKVADQKILLIHSGGDSKRIPQYSACGKLFAPVPRLLPNGKVSCIFDELLMVAAGIPPRIGKGLMIFPSDTELLFNPLQMDLLSCDAAGISMKAPVTVGKDHGVFVPCTETSDHRNQDVSLFLHKQSIATLRSLKAVDSSDQVNIDTGCIWLGHKIISSLLGLISENKIISDKKLREFVNPHVCLNFYADFVYPLAKDGNLEDYYKEAPENGFSDELKSCREQLWGILHQYRLSLVKLVPARYIHFGMTDEMFDLYVNDIEKYNFLNWQRRILTNHHTSGTVINSLIDKSVEVPENCYIENCDIGPNVKIGSHSILSGISIADLELPSDIVMHTLKLKNGKYVCRIYGINDNPKNSRDGDFLGKSLDDLIINSGIKDKDVWKDQISSIWTADIYPATDSPKNAVLAALVVYKIINGLASEKEKNEWKIAERNSLKSSFYSAANEEILKANEHLSSKIEFQKFIDNIASGKPVIDCIDDIDFSIVSDLWYKDLVSEAEKSSFPQNVRLYLTISEISKKNNFTILGHSFEYYEDKAYEIVQNDITVETFKRHNFDWSKTSFIKDELTLELPVRVNFCGSPSDAAPYCLEHGGTMIDGTLLLNGKKPISVTIKKLKEPKIVFSSLDQNCSEEYIDINKVSNCGNPFDPFALHKAVLCACGVIGQSSSPKTIQEFYKIFGGGLSLTTSVDVPKGSGLGTSSIIAAAAIKTVNEIFGQKSDDEKIYAQVFLAEQLMGTGGGWQDQVGGLTQGLKYFTARPGLYQKIDVEYLNLTSETKKELNDRFALIFSGQRRLAKNVLREEMNQCIRNDRNALMAVNDIQEFCSNMRFYLLKGDVTSFAKYITKQFELVKVLDKGSSNTCIEYIFSTIDDLIDGKSICGAGGGGFLQVILKKGVTKQQLKDRINKEFVDCGVDVWDCELI